MNLKFGLNKDRRHISPWLNDKNLKVKISKLFFKLTRPVTESHLHHQSVVLDYYVLYMFIYGLLCFIPGPVSYRGHGL